MKHLSIALLFVCGFSHSGESLEEFTVTGFYGCKTSEAFLSTLCFGEIKNNKGVREDVILDDKVKVGEKVYQVCDKFTCSYLMTEKELNEYLLR